MLLRFSVRNFRSFYEETSFSMVANNRISRHANHVAVRSDTPLLKSAFIYGANASGKSNLVKAIHFAKKIILRGSAEDVTLNQYFKLKKEARLEPGVFQFEIALPDGVYSYGFALSYETGRIVEEWLFRVYKSGREFCIFERDSLDNVNSDLSLNGEARQRFDIYKKDLKVLPRELFLSEMAKKDARDVEEFGIFSAVHRWFERLIVIFPESTFGGLPLAIRDETIGTEFERYLRHFDTGVVGIKSLRTTLEKEVRNFGAVVAEELESDANMHLADGKEFGIRAPGVVLAFHLDDDGELVTEKLAFRHGDGPELFGLNDESDGTQRLIDLVPLLFSDLQDVVVVIDEIDRSLHSKLTLEFLALFHEISEGKNIQMIATTHETALLDLGVLRQDEIWFVERDGVNNSKLYSLNDFKVRFDKQIEKDYLIGRYGAIPLFTAFERGGVEGDFPYD